MDPLVGCAEGREGHCCCVEPCRMMAQQERWAQVARAGEVRPGWLRPVTAGDAVP